MFAATVKPLIVPMSQQASEDSSQSQGSSSNTAMTDLLWADVVDSIHQADPSLLTMRQTQYDRTPIDDREILGINNHALDFPVPIDALGRPDPNEHVSRVEEALLAAYKVSSGDERLTREALRFDTSKLRQDLAQFTSNIDESDDQ